MGSTLSIFSSEITGPIGTKHGHNSPYVIPFKICLHAIQDGRQRGTLFTIGPYGKYMLNIFIPPAIPPL
jgi:hypothetical protein